MWCNILSLRSYEFHQCHTANHCWTRDYFYMWKLLQNRKSVCFSIFEYKMKTPIINGQAGRISAKLNMHVQGPEGLCWFSLDSSQFYKGKYNISGTEFRWFVLVGLWMEKAHISWRDCRFWQKISLWMSAGKKTSPKPLTFPLCHTHPMWTYTSCLAFWWSSDITALGSLCCKIIKIKSAETKKQK